MIFQEKFHNLNIKEEMVKKYRLGPSQIEFFYSSIPFRLFYRLIFPKQAHTNLPQKPQEYNIEKFDIDDTKRTPKQYVGI